MCCKKDPISKNQPANISPEVSVPKLVMVYQKIVLGSTNLRTGMETQLHHYMLLSQEIATWYPGSNHELGHSIGNFCQIVSLKKSCCKAI